MSTFEVVLAVELLLLSWLLLVSEFGGLRVWEPRLLVAFYYIHVAAHLIPSIVFLYDTEVVRPARYLYFWACVIAAVLIPIGGLLGRVAIPVSERTTLAYFRAPVDVSPRVLRVSRWFILGLGLVAVLLLATYVRKAPYYPLKEMIIAQVSTEELNQMRRASFGEDIGYIYGVGRAFLMPFLFVSCVALWRYERYRVVKAIFFMLFIVVIVYNSYTSAKTPVVVLFVLAFCLFFQRRLMVPVKAQPKPAPLPAVAPRAAVAPLPAAAPLPPAVPVTRRPRRRKVGWVALALTLSAAVAYPVFIFQHKTAGEIYSVPEIILYGVVQRVVLKPALTTYQAFEVFPSKRDFTYFGDVGKLAWVLGIEPVNLSRVVAAMMEGRGVAIAVGDTKVVNAPPATIGTFYAEAGWPAVVLGTLAGAMMMQALQGIFVVHRVKTPIHQALYTVLMYATLRLNLSSFHSVLLSEAIVPVALCLVAFEVVWRTRLMPVVGPVPAGAAR